MNRSTVDPAGRAAAVPSAPPAGPVTLVNCFVVEADRDDVFLDLWKGTSEYFRSQPGYRSLRLHRALSPDAPYRYINVANWASAAEFQAAHQKQEFFQVVGQPAWREFPSSPVLYEVVVEHTAG
jgi:heme-degrading monooxygenase HmoA